MSCEGEDDWACRNEIKENYLGRVIGKQKDFLVIGEMSGLGEGAAIGEIKSRLAGEEMAPIKDNEAIFRLNKAKSSIFVNRDKEIIQTAPAVLISDLDRDGLPDATEKRIGTDPYNPDTDGDGYGDKAEIENGYDPRGEGRLGRDPLVAIDRAIINNEMIEHPKTDGPVNAAYEVAEVENTLDERNETAGYVIRGKAEPRQVLSLFIYSDLPVVTTVTTDEFGNWQYEFENILVDGDHEAYVALNDETGKILEKSNPLSFFVREAKAVSIHDYVAAAVVENPTEPEGMINYYLIFAFILIGFSIFLFVIYLGYYRKKTVN